MLSILLSFAAQAAVAASGSAAPTAAAPSVPAADAAPFGAPLATATLGETTAREDLAQIVQNDQVAGVSNNQINGPSTTGSVTIDGNAFQNMSGLAVISANSGNNVAINAALNVNVNITPRP